MRNRSEIEERIPRPEGAARKHKMVPWMWGIVAVICVGVVYAGGVVVNAVDWTKVMATEINGKGGGETEIADKNDQQSESGEGEGRIEPEEKPEEKPVEKPEVPEEPQPAKPSAPEEKPVQPIEPRPNTSVDDPKVEGKKVIALTFDDGPSPATTPRLLDILKGRNAKATFFVLGTMAQRSPDLMRREVAEGHEVASHTPYHNQLTKLSFAQVRAEAVEMDRIFTEILGTRPPFTRPPYGSQNATVGQALGQPMVLWSIDPRDWQDRNASTVCSRVVSAARNGAIILVHDIHASTVDAVPCIIDSLRAQEYEFLTVSELAKVRGVTMVNGGVYYNF